jgi:hypothetical protein
MQKTWLVLMAGFAGFAATWFMRGDARKHGDRLQLKEQVQAWEDEGGNVPDVQTVSPDRGAP